jgi:hypothetical protein
MAAAIQWPVDIRANDRGLSAVATCWISRLDLSVDGLDGLLRCRRPGMYAHWGCFFLSGNRMEQGIRIGNATDGVVTAYIPAPSIDTSLFGPRV